MICWRICLSASKSHFPASMQNSTIAAVFSAASDASCDSWLIRVLCRLSSSNPAQSKSTQSICSSCSRPVRTSRVVASMPETMLREWPSIALSRRLLPAFGRPARPTESISMMRSQRILPSSRSVSCCRIESTSLRASAAETNIMSSSEKSNPASRRPSNSMIRVRNCAIVSENRPCSKRSAAASCVVLAADTISATASACVRSILPFRNARWVNSPGAAGRTN